MRQYLELVRTVLDEGTWQDNRTGIRTIWLPGLSLRLDLKRDGFPAVTTKKLAFKTVVGELIGFLRASTSAADFRALGCRVWDQNANENADWLGNPYRKGTDDLGPVYGYQWRKWPAYKLIDCAHSVRIDDAIRRGFRVVGTVTDGGVPMTLLYRPIDQLRMCLDAIVNNPDSRRILFHGWNCADNDRVALPACHLLYQFHPNPVAGEISLSMFVRSNDVGLGAPFNLCEGAVLLHLVGRLTGYRPRWLAYHIGNAHIYENHLDMLHEQLRREPLPAPRLVINDRVPDYAVTRVYAPEWLELVEPSDFTLEGYVHHPPLTAPMAV